MRLIITFAVLLMASVCGLSAQNYTLHSASRGVTVTSGGKTAAAEKGMALKPADMLTIPQDGSVEVYNPRDKRIYSSVRPGQVSVAKLVIEARKVSADNSAGISQRLNFGAGHRSSKNVYTEKGVVTRSQAVYDPESEGIEMDAKALAQYVAATMGDVSNVTNVSNVSNASASSLSGCPVDLSHERTADGGLKFTLRNTLDYPVYFNVLRLSADGSKIEISQLGQPDGTYLLLPTQTLSREHPAGLNPAETHLLLMTPTRFDINVFLEEMTRLLDLPAADAPAAPTDLPAFISPL